MRLLDAAPEPLVYPEKLVNACLAASIEVAAAFLFILLLRVGRACSDLLAMGIKTNRRLNPEPQAETSIDSSATKPFNA